MLPEAGAGRKIDFLDRKRVRAIGERERKGTTKLSMESFEKPNDDEIRTGRIKISAQWW